MICLLFWCDLALFLGLVLYAVYHPGGRFLISKSAHTGPALSHLATHWESWKNVAICEGEKLSFLSQSGSGLQLITVPPKGY